MKKERTRNKLHYQLNLLPSLKVNISPKIEGTVLKGQINISGFWAMWSLLQLLCCCCLGRQLQTRCYLTATKKQPKCGLWALVVNLSLP